MSIKPAWIFALIEVGRWVANSVVTPIPAPKGSSFVPSCPVFREGGGGIMCGKGGT